MKYRILTDEELVHLEEELVQFLIVNGVDGTAWKKMNLESPNQAIRLVELFSDTVLQKVYENIRFLEFRSPETCMIFNCGKDELELISIQRKNSSLDLSTPEKIHQCLVESANGLSFFQSKKSYTLNRELEIHQMLEQGCVLSTSEFWEALKSGLMDN